MGPKRKSFFSNSSRKKPGNMLGPGVRGFLCTCNGLEKICLKESYNILNEYADKLYGEQKVNGDNIDSDPKEIEDTKEIEDQFSDEIEELKGGIGNKNKCRFNVINTGVPNCLFIKTGVEDPVNLIHFLMKDLKESQQRKTRQLLRIVPVEITCYAGMEDIMKSAGSLFDKYFAETEPTTFAIIFNRRYNNVIERDVVIKQLAEMVSERNADHKVDLRNSKLTIIVEIMKSVCCMSVLPDYFDLCKYNLHSIVPIDEKTAAASTDIVSPEQSSGLSTNEPIVSSPDSIPAQEE